MAGHSRPRHCGRTWEYHELDVAIIHDPDTSRRRPWAEVPGTLVWVWFCPCGEGIRREPFAYPPDMPEIKDSPDKASGSEGNRDQRLLSQTVTVRSKAPDSQDDYPNGRR